MTYREQTDIVHIGNVAIGGGNPVFRQVQLRCVH